MLIHPFIEDVGGGGRGEVMCCTLIPRCCGEDSHLAKSRLKVRRKVRRDALRPREKQGKRER